MDAAPRIDQHAIRLWALRTQLQEVVGAVVPGSRGPKPGSACWAVVSTAILGEESDRTINGRRFSVRPVGQFFQVWRPCQAEEEAIALLVDEKRKMLADGWVEVSLDPVNDPN